MLWASDFCAECVLAETYPVLSDLHPDEKLMGDRCATGNDLTFGTGKPLRGRPRFAMDAASKGAEATINSCQKSHVALNSRTGGVFSFFCRHGFCYGYAWFDV
jgi:hypothetical protein